MTNIRRKFGSAVRQLREDSGYSQEKFAGVVKVDRTYYSRIERGLANVTIEVVVRIANGLKISLVELFAAVEQH